MIAHYFRCLLTIISPTLNTKVLYWFKHHRRINLKSPQDLNEKILKLKLDSFEFDEKIKSCADKYRVRQYVIDKGLNTILLPLIGTYDSVNDIDWNALPNRFAMKWNFGCGFNFICEDKTKYNYLDVYKMMNKWGKTKYYLPYSEMQYKDVPHKILIEEYMMPEKGKSPADYKFYCFNGKPMVILYIEDRNTDEMKAAFFSLDWKIIGSTGKANYKIFDEVPSKPECLTEMIEVAKILSQDFPFVRVDLYCYHEKTVFGELTFTPAGGFCVSQCKIDGKPMGEYLHI